MGWDGLLASSLELHTSDIWTIEYKERGVTFGIAPKVTKSLGPKPPKAEKPGGIPKIRKLATLRQYGFFYGIPPAFLLRNAFSGKGRGVTGVTRVTGRKQYSHLFRVSYLTPLVL